MNESHLLSKFLASWLVNLSLTTNLVSPQVFQAVGAGQNALLLSGFFGVCKVVSCAFFLIFLVERIGRRWSLLAGSFLMGTYMFIIAVLTQRYPPVSGGTLAPPAIASLTMVFLEASECPKLIVDVHNFV